ncbi:MAG TPA: hypothetical protein VGL53_04460 [Bryobacteraceae bacterium]|jgi:hypothetical protein
MKTIDERGPTAHPGYGGGSLPVTSLAIDFHVIFRLAHGAAAPPSAP